MGSNDSLLQIANAESNSKYIAACKTIEINSHPARFPSKLPEFFINFLTEPGDIVLDIFAGSNTTGQAAEANGRQWLSFDIDPTYVAGSAFKFFYDEKPENMKQVYKAMLSGETIDVKQAIQIEQEEITSKDITQEEQLGIWG